jgi:hypothetical protein
MRGKSGQFCPAQLQQLTPPMWPDYAQRQMIGFPIKIPGGYEAGLLQAVRYFVAFVWMRIVFSFTRHSANEGARKWKVLGIVFAASLFLAFLSWSNLGTHVENADPVTGGGDTVTDYEPTDAERNQSATLIFLLTFVPAIVALAQKEKT